MAHYRKIDSRIQNDAKFCALSMEGQLAFFLLLTHPHMTAVGAMRATPEGLAAEYKWLPGVFAKAFAEVLDKGMVKYSPDGCLIVVPNLIKYNRPESPNVVKKWVTIWNDLPECNLKKEHIAFCFKVLGQMGKAFLIPFVEAFGEESQKSMLNQKAEYRIQNKKINTPNGVFVASAKNTGGHNPPTQKSTPTKTPDDKIPPCPFDEIQKLYNEILPELPRCRAVTENRKKYLRARWRQNPDMQTPEAWERYFKFIRKCKLLMGQKTDFVANFDWIIKPTNFQKIIEGNYHD